MKNRVYIFLLMGLGLLGCGGPGSDAQLEGAVPYWNSQALTLIKARATIPIKASRALAMMHVAMFDAAMAVTPTYKPYVWTPSAADTLDSQITFHPSVEVTVGAAAYYLLLQLFPEDEATLSASYSTWFPGGASTLNDQQAVLLGERAANYIFTLRLADDGLTGPGVPTAALAVWSPTPPANANPSFPGWGQLTPFTMSSVSQFRQAAPPDVTTDQYADDYNQARYKGVKATAGLTISTRSTTETETAYFWDDASGTVTAPGHWNLIAQGVADRKGLEVVEQAKLFALLNLAMADAAIAAWDMKYTYWFWRPLTALRGGFDDGNLSTTVDAAWEPLITTPATPEYASDHSAFAGAASRVLASVIGSDATAFFSTSDGVPDVRRSYTSFSSAAEEAGHSRIFAGTHFEFSNQAGLAAGRAIADQVVATFLRPN